MSREKRLQLDKKKWRDVCLIKLLFKFTILKFKEALRFALLFNFLFKHKKNEHSVGHFALKWNNVLRNRWPG